MSNGLVAPQSEIVIKFEEREIAVIAFFPDEEDGADVVCGMENPGALEIVASLLQQAAFALRACFQIDGSSQDDGSFSGVENGKADHPF